MDCPELVKRRVAAKRLGRNERWLDKAPIPRRDMRLPGARRPEWMWCSDDLDAFVEARKVKPGHASPIE